MSFTLKQKCELKKIPYIKASPNKHQENRIYKKYSPVN